MKLKNNKGYVTSGKHSDKVRLSFKNKNNFYRKKKQNKMRRKRERGEFERRANENVKKLRLIKKGQKN